MYFSVSLLHNSSDMLPTCANVPLIGAYRHSGSINTIMAVSNLDCNVNNL